MKKLYKEQGVFEKYLVLVNCMAEETYHHQEGAMRNRILKIEKLMEIQKRNLDSVDNVYEKVQGVDDLQQKLDKLLK